MSRPVALVTGASRGIGRAIAIALSRHGYDLVITCKTQMDLLNKTAKTIRSNEVTCVAVQVDVSDIKQVDALFTQHVQANFSRLDLVVNNAGISYVGLLTDMALDTWAQVMDTNLNSLFYTSKWAVPMMVQQKSGNIINISSIWGGSGASCEVAYSTSKGGMNSFTKALAKELAPSNIRVNAIACGAIDTDMNEWMTEEDRDAFLEEVPLGRMGTVNDIAETVLFLTSDKASYITGQILTVDGGL